MKHRTGYLFKRGSNFYLNWKVAGKVFTRALRDDNGGPITNSREAEEARQKLMAPFAVADQAAVLESMVGRLQGRKAELAGWEDQQNPPLPISQVWTGFLASPNRPDSGGATLYQYECQWSRFAEWMKEKHPNALTLREVTKDIAEEYAGNLNHGALSPNTYNKHLGLLTLVFRVVKGKAKLTENVWEDLQRKRLATNSRRELTMEELRKVCQSATGELQILLAMGIYSGLRLGDCATLRWCEVDLERGLIRRIPNKIARSPNPKTVQIPVHPTLAAMLSAIRAEERTEYVLPKTAATYAHRTDEVTDSIQAHFKACGIKVWKSGTGPDSKDGKRAVIEVGFHSLRHSFVSMCRAGNVPLSVVEALVGHSNPAMSRHYTHVGELAATTAVAALPAVIGKGKPGSQQQDPAALLVKIKRIAETMSANNWEKKRGQLLAFFRVQK